MKSSEKKERYTSVFGSRPLPRTIAEVEESTTGCSPEQERNINLQKMFTVLLLVIIMVVPIVIPVLVYYHMTDGIVEVKVDGAFSLPDSFSVYSPIEDYGDFGNPNNVLTVDGDNTGSYKFDVVDIRVMFGNIPRSRTSEDILKAFLYDDDTHDDITEYFCRYTYLGRSVSFTGVTNITDMRGVTKTVRVPRGEGLILVMVTIRSRSIKPYFTASFVAAIGNEYDNVVDGNKLVITIHSASFDGASFSQWMNWWDDSDTYPMPSSSPWGLNVSLEKFANNPDLLDPQVK